MSTVRRLLKAVCRRLVDRLVAVFPAGHRTNRSGNNASQR